MAWKASPDVMLQRLGDSVVLVDLASDRILELNETAGRLFELVSEGNGQDAIEERLRAEFDVDPFDVREEINVTLTSLASEGVVVPDAG